MICDLNIGTCIYMYMYLCVCRSKREESARAKARLSSNRVSRVQSSEREREAERKREPDRRREWRERRLYYTTDDTVIFPREGRLWNLDGTRKNTRTVPF